MHSYPPVIYLCFHTNLCDCSPVKSQFLFLTVHILLVWFIGSTKEVLVKLGFETYIMLHARLATSRLFRSEKVISSDEVARVSVSDVSRKRSTCFTCKNVSQSVTFWREKAWLTFLTFHVLRARSSRKQKLIPNKLHVKRLRVLFEYCSQINLFVYSAVCREHYWQTAKAAPLSNASWKDKTVFKPIRNYFIDLQML